MSIYIYTVFARTRVERRRRVNSFTRTMNFPCLQPFVFSRVPSKYMSEQQNQSNITSGIQEPASWRWWGYSETTGNIAKSSRLPRLRHGSKFAYPTIFTYHSKEYTISTIYREAKVSKTLQIIRKMKTGVSRRQTCSCSQIGIAEGEKILRSLGATKPSSSIVNGCGIAGSWKVGETIMFSAKEGGGFIGTGVLMPLANPTFLLRLANMIRKGNAYLELTC